MNEIGVPSKCQNDLEIEVVGFLKILCDVSKIYCSSANLF